MHTAIIVDDENDQQEVLKKMLSDNFEEYQVLKICNTIPDAAKSISALKPQLVFLDVMLPPYTGFDLFDLMKEINFETIFCSSFQEYSLKALKLSAVDYLLKPFGIDDLRIALNKFEDKIKISQDLQHIKTLLHNINANTSEQTKIALPTMSGFLFVQVNDIIHCESDNAYTTFYIKDKAPIVVSRNMKDCEELLISFNFFRIHTSHLINMKYISEYLKGDGGQVKMSDGTVLDVSRRKKEDFLNTLNKI